jgi:predicted flap endonuclease-1-like 5' DNA nuclease
MAKLETIEGIGPIYAEKLRAAGVRSVKALLRAGATPGGRKELEGSTGIGHEYILDWVNRADLMRVRGVGEEYSDLLEKAGVDTVVELAQRNPDHLYRKITQVNDEKRLVRRPPTRGMVGRWVAHAKALPRVVSH